MTSKYVIWVSRSSWCGRSHDTRASLAPSGSTTCAGGWGGASVGKLK